MLARHTETRTVKTMKNQTLNPLEAFLAASDSLQPKKVLPDSADYITLSHEWCSGREWPIEEAQQLIDILTAMLSDNDWAVSGTEMISHSTLQMDIARGEEDEGYSLALRVNALDLFDVAIIHNTTLGTEFFGGKEVPFLIRDVGLGEVVDVVLKGVGQL